MSRFQKIFLASALVAVGFAVATFLGQPVLPTQSNVSDRTLLPAFPLIGASSAQAVGAPQGGGRARLLPDTKLSFESGAAISPSVAATEAPLLGTSLTQTAASNNASNYQTAPRNFDFDPIASSPIAGSDATRARLRNEAPRAVGVDPQSPATIRRLPTESVEKNDLYKVADTTTAPSAWPAPQLLNSEYTEVRPAPPTAVPASYSAPVDSTTQSLPASQLTPSPWPMPTEVAEPRTHLVADGDSLERLAGRYLSDPQRGREIYDLNRDVLSSPDLLPIGVELKIPDRVAAATVNRRGFSPNSTNAAMPIAAGYENMTQSQSTPSPQGIIPRAQLAPPVMVQ